MKTANTSNTITAAINALSEDAYSNGTLAQFYQGPVYKALFTALVQANPLSNRVWEQNPLTYLDPEDLENNLDEIRDLVNTQAYYLSELGYEELALQWEATLSRI